jgi:hypothetical protein
LSTDAQAPGAVLDVNLSPTGFRHWAKHYLACRRCFVAPDSGFSPVPYFLDCRAIELELKSRHLNVKPTKQVKTTYWHNLDALYDDLPAPERRLSLEERRLLAKANSIYRNKGFEYFSSYAAVRAFSDFPSLEQLDQLAVLLIEGDA